MLMAPLREDLRRFWRLVFRLVRIWNSSRPHSCRKPRRIELDWYHLDADLQGVDASEGIKIHLVQNLTPSHLQNLQNVMIRMASEYTVSRTCYISLFFIKQDQTTTSKRLSITVFTIQLGFGPTNPDTLVDTFASHTECNLQPPPVLSSSKLTDRLQQPSSNL
ncbi:hypothetical protein BJ508DRAFT_27822 [Ascobolus immersus RN42]|uniref:Uncharacterized protein n=1 Tax=Ascobolus immersus RN42 TaxID=1160509 RepID=A0A3N4IFD0_ASCIM|nr:hypothetical protein BJ508DRAFT_27822 [Ascobolus immersus RN42]